LLRDLRSSSGSTKGIRNYITSVLSFINNSLELSTAGYQLEAERYVGSVGLLVCVARIPTGHTSMLAFKTVIRERGRLVQIPFFGPL
jgi:hypothetical protein